MISLEDYISLDEVKEVCSVVSQLIAQDSRVAQEVATVVIPEEEITRVVDLDAISSCVHGITDILGQIADWFRSLIESVAKWIVERLGEALSIVKDAILSSLGTLRSFFESTIGKAVGEIGGRIASAITTIISTLQSAISSAIAGVAEGVSGLASAVSTIASSILSAISSVGSSISSAISSAVSSLSSAISSVASSLASAISGAVSSIQSAISATLSAITSAISSVASSIISAISSLASSVASMLSSIASAIAGIASTIISIVSSAISAISSAISSIASSIMSAISSLGSSIMGAVSGIASAIQGAISGAVSVITSIGSTILSAISGIVSAISGVVSTVASIGSSIMGAISTATSSIISAVSGLASTVATVASSIISAVSSAISESARTILGALDSIASRLASLISSIANIIPIAFKVLIDSISGILTGLRDYVAGAFEKVFKAFEVVGKQLFDVGKGIHGLFTFLVASFNEVIAKVGAGFQAISNAFMGFVNAILRIPEMILSGLRGIGEWIWSVAPDWFKNAFVAIANFFTKDVVTFFTKTLPEFVKAVADAVATFVKDPVGWLNEHLVKPAYGLLEMIWGAVFNIAKWVLETAMTGTTRWFINASTGVMDAISGFFKEAVAIIASIFGKITQTVWNALSGTIKALESLFRPPIDEMAQSLKESVSAEVKTIMERITEVANLPPPTAHVITQTALGHAFFIGALLLPFWGQLPLRAVAWTSKAIAKWLRAFNWNVRIDLRPFGIGVSTTFNLAEALGATFWTFAEELDDYAKEIGRGLIYGFAIWTTRTLNKIINFWMRNLIPVELPTVDEMLEMLRRSIPHEKFAGVWFAVKQFLCLEGYSDVIIDLLIERADRYFIEITDRFEQKRVVPLSLVYELPSASDVARMMVRDIIIELESFKKVFKARGMHEDIAVLYYLLHFRYPPPERLWEFTVRGISGLLWATIPDEEKKVLLDEVRKVGIDVNKYFPQAPASLNFASQKLLDALKTYMKWHDYARFSYIAGFTSDNLIYIDTLADIPTKIDQRWMVKWGLYELLSTKKVTHASPIQDFVYKVVEPSRASEVTLDLTNFCRTLQATGLHPYWVPVTAVAESMNVLTEERTLLRTGFINLFKEGFWDVVALEKLLAGFVVASFNVAYFDVSDMKWHTGWINLPVMFLPAERRLLELRALMDRALDVLREVQRDISNAYQDNIIKGYEEYKELLSKVIADVNEVFSKDYEKITGVRLPDELKLRFVEDYYKPYVHALGIYKDVYTIRRVRSWTMRFIGWVMYRVATGLVTKEELSRLVDVVINYAKLTGYEKEFIEKVFEVMSGIAVRDYAPSPSTLATLAEYVVVPSELIEKAFEVKMIPEEWRSIWRQYIKIRPIADDVKSLLSAYRRALVYAKVPEPLEKQILELAREVGYTDKELAVLTLRAQLEELILASKEFLPSPATLATLAEYVPLPDELVKRALEARRVPPEWVKVWLTYVKVRPIADDVRGLLSAYRRALLYVAVPDEVRKKVEEYASLIGFTQVEWDVLNLRVLLEEMILNSREYIPTPLTLATLAEYVPEAREFFKEVMVARRVPERWQAVWAKYIDVRPLVDDIKRYLARAEQLYVRFMIRKEDFEKIVSEVAGLLGYTNKEVEFLMRVTDFERYRNAWVELIGTVERLVQLSEYSPRASKFALAKVYEMIDALPLPPKDKQELKLMWEEYIRNRPVKSEAKLYITQVINAYVEGLISKADFEKELESMKKWGFSDAEVEFYKAQAEVRRARKLKVPLVYGE